MPDKSQSGISASAAASAAVSSGGSAMRAEARTVGAPIEYKVVDEPWSPSEPSAAEAMLTEIGQDGWRLTTVYPDPQRERTRWIFTR